MAWMHRSETILTFCKKQAKYQLELWLINVFMQYNEQLHLTN